MGRLSRDNLLLEWLRMTIERIMGDVLSDISRGKTESKHTYELPFGTVSVSVRLDRSE